MRCVPFFVACGEEMTIPVPLVITISVLATFLSACGASDEGSGVGGVTPGEAQALNEAAEMLDERERRVSSSPTADDDIGGRQEDR